MRRRRRRVYGWSDGYRMLDGMWGYVPLLILIGNERIRIFMIIDGDKRSVYGVMSRVRWRMGFWDIRAQNGISMWGICDGEIWDIGTENGFKG